MISSLNGSLPATSNNSLNQLTQMISSLNQLTQMISSLNQLTQSLIPIVSQAYLLQCLQSLLKPAQVLLLHLASTSSSSSRCQPAAAAGQCSKCVTYKGSSSILQLQQQVLGVPAKIMQQL
jgi:hypothetical protein